MEMATKINYDELRTVFAACDPSKSGYITFDDFAGLARQYGDASDHWLRDAEQLVEDKQHRRLSFSEFSHIVANIIHNHDGDANGTEGDEQMEAERRRTNTSHSKPPNLLGSYSDSNLISLENEVSNADRTVARVNGGTDGIVTIAKVRSEEEDRYEDFGDDMSEFGRNAMARGTWPIHRVVNLPESAAVTLQRSLVSQSHSVNAHSRRTSRTQSEAPSSAALNARDELIDNWDSNFDILNDKMQNLQRQVEHLTKSHEKSESKSSHLKLDNQRLADRANVLEEQLHEMRSRHEQELMAEKQRYRELQTKYEREVVDLTELTKSRVLIDEYRARIQLLETSNNDLRDDCARLRADNERFKSETHRLELELRDAKSSSEQLGTEHRKCTNKTSKLQKQLEEQKQLIATLSSELESSRTLRSDLDFGFASSPLSNGSLSHNGNENADFSVLSRIGELEEQAKRLANENRSLKEMNEELHGSILSGSFDRGRRLIFQKYVERSHSNSGSRRGTLIPEEEQSLAAELELLNEQSRDDIMEQLVKEKEANQKLKIYIDKIILKVLEKYPEILEVK